MHVGYLFMHEYFDARCLLSCEMRSRHDADLQWVHQDLDTLGGFGVTRNDCGVKKRK